MALQPSLLQLVFAPRCTSAARLFGLHRNGCATGDSDRLREQLRPCPAISLTMLFRLNLSGYGKRSYKRVVSCLEPAVISPARQCWHCYSLLLHSGVVGIALHQ